MKHAFVFTTALFVMSAPAALAQGGGWYVSGMGGASFVQDADNTGSGVTIKSTTDTGFDVAGAVGREFGNGFRVEGEIGYRQANLDKLKLTNGFGPLNGFSIGASGDVSALSFMVNGYYDWDLGMRLKPYVGGGIGVARVAANDVRIVGVQIVDDDDAVFAYQVGAGLGYSLTEKLSAFVDYRYFATTDPTFKLTGGGSFDSEFKSHNISVGLRYRF